MVSEAQKRADSKWKKANTKQVILRLYPADMDIYEHLQRQENRNDYLRRLIRRDMEGK